MTMLFRRPLKQDFFRKAQSILTRDGSFDRPCKCAACKPYLDFRAVERFREISKKPFSKYRGAPCPPLFSRFNFPIKVKFGYVIGLMGAEGGKIGKKIKKIPYLNHASAKNDFSAFSTLRISSKRAVAPIELWFSFQAKFWSLL